MSSQFLTLLTLFSLAIADANDLPVARPNCSDHCGDISIPFPFGIGAGCFSDEWFEIKCRDSQGPPKPYLSKSINMEVMEIILGDEAYESQSIIVGLPPFIACVSEISQLQSTSVDLRRTPFSFLTSFNVFSVQSCSGNAVLRDKQNEIIVGCGTVCESSNAAIPEKGCYGVKCCQTPLSSSDAESLDLYHVDAYLQGGNGACFRAGLTKRDSAGKLSSFDGVAPVIMSWSVAITLESNHNSHVGCNPGNGYDEYEGFNCYCEDSYFENPYLPYGCQVPEQCKHCEGSCGQLWNYTSNRAIPNLYVCGQKPLNLPTIFGGGISVGVVVLVVGIYGLYRYVKRRREIKRKAKFFKRNGGLLLHQQLDSNTNATKVFTISELDNATNHFNENRILGQGGQGTVYKCMLADGRIIAIKKAKLLDESQLEQFINEVVILSQINHRNVVKLFGCCLETEVPLLVYEYIPNGTLFEHIHDPDEDFSINWEKRLKIVLDSASAIAYLHSSASIPIYHRDIKSSNILLDERHRAKVSDFGSSKSITIDQTHLTTLVQGTLGYLDPEYFQSYQFTDKSDVYSFGVVLLELLTSKKPIYKDGISTEQKNLVIEFSSLMEQSALSNILDSAVVREAKDGELMAVIKLATRCIQWSGKLRPTMKEVAMTPKMITKSPGQVSTLFQQQDASRSTETAITEETHVEFMWNPASGVAIGALYIDVKPKPRLSDTI